MNIKTVVVSLLLGIIIFFFSCFPQEHSNQHLLCLTKILESQNIPKQEYIECMETLMEDSVNSDVIFSKLSVALTSSEYEDFVDIVDVLSAVPSNYDYFDFVSKPLIEHRYRAIKNILLAQLRNDRVHPEVVINTIEKYPNHQLSIDILYCYQNTSNTYLDFLFDKTFVQSSYFSNPSKLKTIVRGVLLNANTERYSSRIAEYESR